MREIKFRAWDGKRMTTSGIMFNNTTSCLEFPFGSQMKLMQYTGLKDKNGKDIYEGDVVKDYYCEYVDDKYNVGFSDGFFYPLVQVEQGYNCIDKYDKNRFEVIGNIYENPELLNND